MLQPLFSLSSTFDAGSLLDYLSLFLYVLGHAYKDAEGQLYVEHILGNLMFVLLLGPIIEEKYGSRNLLIMIVFTALITAIFNILFFSSGIVGASGIVFMLIILASFTNMERGGIPLTFILVMVLFIGKEVMNSFQQDNISQFGHIIGGICGSLFGFSGIVGTKDKAQPEL